MTTPIKTSDPVRGELVDAAIRLLATDGAEALVLRRVASAAHVSTMCVYSRFGDKFGLLNAVYLGGFDRLNRELSDADRAPEPRQRLLDLGVAYRRFALANPALYALMFERMLGFEPSPELRSDILQRCFAIFVAAATEAIEQGSIAAETPIVAAYTFWTAAHGSVSLELTQGSPGPLRDMFAAGDESYMRVLKTTLRGLEPASHQSAASPPDIVGK